MAIADLIRCKPDEPRLIDPTLKSEIHEIMQTVEERIVQSAKRQATIETAPTELSSDQSAVLVALQQAMNRPEIVRQRVITVLESLSRPLLSAPVKELRLALSRYRRDGDAGTFVTACESVATMYSTQPRRTSETAESRPTLSRQDLRLICFEFLS